MRCSGGERFRVQLTNGGSLVLGHAVSLVSIGPQGHHEAASDKVGALAWNRDPREIKTGALNQRERNQLARRPRRSAYSGLYSIISPDVSAAACGPNPGSS